jgi:hypothetical protein
MANMNIRSKECAWHQSEIMIFGRVLTGIRGWEIKKTVEKEPLYGAGQEPIDITEGNRKTEGNIKVLGFEADELNKAAQIAGFDDITSVPHELIVMNIKFKKTLADLPTNIAVRGISFTECGDSLEQGAKNREITLPFIAMDMVKIAL